MGPVTPALERAYTGALAKITRPVVGIQVIPLLPVVILAPRPEPPEELAVSIEGRLEAYTYRLVSESRRHEEYEAGPPNPVLAAVAHEERYGYAAFSVSPYVD